MIYNTTYELAFCGFCGILLPPGLGNKPDPRCPNCNEPATNETNLTGDFKKEVGERLLEISWGKS